MRFIKTGAWILFTLLLLSFAIALIGQNTELLTVTLLNYTSPPQPKWALLLGCIFLGAVVTSLFFVVELIVLETKNIRLRRQLRLLSRALEKQGGTIPQSIKRTTDTDPKFIKIAEDDDDLSDV